jgi:hypothetical protein
MLILFLSLILLAPASASYNMIVPANPGGGYDTYSRIFARTIKDVVVRNVPGASGLIGSRYLYHRAKKDSTFGMVLPYNVIMQALGEDVLVDFRNFRWIGNLNSYRDDRILFLVRKDRADKDVFIVGTSGRNTTGLAKLLAFATGLKFKIVKGYKGTAGVNHALLTGEIDATVYSRSSLISSNPDWESYLEIQVVLDPNMVTDPVVKFGLSHYRMARPLAMPPYADPMLVYELRKRFNSNLAKLRKEYSDRGLLFSPTNNREVLKVVESILSTPQSVISKYKNLIK